MTAGSVLVAFTIMPVAGQSLPPAALAANIIKQARLIGFLLLLKQSLILLMNLLYLRKKKKL